MLNDIESVRLTLTIFCQSPGLGHIARVASTVDLQHVSVAADWVAHG